MGWATFWAIFSQTHLVTLDDYLDIFAEKFSKKNGVFDSKQS
jgi:hypothetical protein